MISLTDAGLEADKIRMLGVPVHVLGMKRGNPSPVVLIKLSLQLVLEKAYQQDAQLQRCRNDKAVQLFKLSQGSD